MNCNPAMRIILKLFELIGCIACLITKQLTDQQARRIAFRNQKFSREWSLLSNVTWTREGNAFANVTYGGYTLIIGLILISKCVNPKAKPTCTDKIFLIFGVLFFFILGGLIYASIEQIPPELFDYAIILGTLSFTVGFLFLIDFIADKSKRLISSQTQTDLPNIHQSSTQTSLNRQTSEFKQLNIPNLENDINNSQLSPTLSDGQTIPPQSFYFPGERVDVQVKDLPKSQQPVITKVYASNERLGAIQKPKLKKLTKKCDKTNEGYCSDVNTSTAKKDTSYYSKSDPNTSEEDNFGSPISPGFVGRAARFWDRKAKRGTYGEKSTIV